jgi:sRNA-binding carbon storage regulator CsrA
LGIEADRRIPIHREEIYGKMKHRSLEPSEPPPTT